MSCIDTDVSMHDIMANMARDEISVYVSLLIRDRKSKQNDVLVNWHFVVFTIGLVRKTHTQPIILIDGENHNILWCPGCSVHIVDIIQCSQRKCSL